MGTLKPPNPDKNRTQEERQKTKKYAKINEP